MNLRLYAAVGIRLEEGVPGRMSCSRVVGTGRGCSNRPRFAENEGPQRWCTPHAADELHNRRRDPRYRDAVAVAAQPVTFTVSVDADTWLISGPPGGDVRGMISTDGTLTGLEYALQRAALGLEPRTV